MRPKFACADFTFPLLPHDKVLQLIALLDIKGVDIGLFEKRSHLWPSREFKNPKRSARALKRKLDDKNLRPADIFLQTGSDFTASAVNHPQARRRRRVRDLYLQTLEYAAECQCQHVTILPGVHFKEEEPYAASFGRMVDELSWRLDQARAAGLVLGVEAHVGSIAARPQQAQKMVQSVPGLTLTLDYTHFVRSGYPDTDAEPLLQAASHFHVRGARKGRLQVSFDEDTIDYKRVYRVMEEVGYRGWIGLEYVWIDWERCNECDNLSETIRYRDFFRSLVR